MNSEIPDEGEKEKHVVESAPESPDTGKVGAISREQRKDSESLMQGLPELTPEQIEVIMEKVQDIDECGIAFSVLPKRPDFDIESVFQDGLLGTSLKEHDGCAGHKITRKEWITLREKQDAAVHFNIVGRMDNSWLRRRLRDNPAEDIASSYWMRPGKIAILFDISTMKELLPSGYRTDQQNANTFRGAHGYGDLVQTIGWEVVNRLEELPRDTPMADPRVQEIIEDLREYEPYCDIPASCIIDQPSDTGFIACHRIKPAQFRGIVIHESELLCGTVNSMRSSYADRSEKLLPVYDKDGNLLWPKKMSYEEVQEFVAQRDEKETE